jgi:NADH-quinone oxidoreductase subunit C
MEELFRELAEKTGSEFLGFRNETGYWKLSATVESLPVLMENLYRDNAFWCDFLQSITAVHIPGNPEKIQLHYHLESLTKGWKVQVICEQSMIDREQMLAFPSMTALWKAAGWHEREAAELFGIQFTGHPDLRKLLLPADWKGYPLRKDYQAEETYHGLKIRYEREG